MKKIKRLIIVGLLSFSHLVGAESIRDFWFSGAEINRYELSQTLYNKSHPGHAELIFVTEPFLIEEQVKNEFGQGPSTDVLKLNALRTFNTGIYSYRAMTSTFQPIDLKEFPHALKTGTSVQDWCGQVFQQINKSESGWKGELRSYFQRKGDQDFDLPEVWLEDELWLRLRLDPQSLPTGNFKAVPGAIYTRLSHVEIKPIAAEAKLFPDSKTSLYAIRYPAINRTLEIEFETNFPHIIRAWKEISPKGQTTAKLTHRVMNSEYWSQNSPEDAKKRKTLGLDPIVN
ncbi:MAG: septum formation inhibitor Maf [Verrucomicrobiota bacterium]